MLVVKKRKLSWRDSMPRKFRFDQPQNTPLDVVKVDKQEIELIPKITQISEWRPSRIQREYKVQFMRKLEDLGIEGDVSVFSQNKLQEICPNHLLPGWMKDKHFCAWFFHITEFEDRLESLFALSLDALEDILLDNDPKNASARISAVKTISELTGRMGKKNDTVNYIDKNITTMDKQQLEEFIKKQMPKNLIEVTKDE